MKTKLEMAHEWAMRHGDAETVGSRQNMIKYAWDYADAMQAEADKREKEEIDKQSAELRNILNLSNSKPLELQPDLEDWQPDWSQAPDNDVQYFAVDEDGQGGWYITKPTLCSDHWYWSEWGERLNEYDHAPSFGYTGDWRNSLRKRPK